MSKKAKRMLIGVILLIAGIILVAVGYSNYTNLGNQVESIFSTGSSDSTGLIMMICGSGCTFAGIITLLVGAFSKKN